MKKILILMALVAVVFFTASVADAGRENRYRRTCDRDFETMEVFCWNELISSAVTPEPPATEKQVQAAVKKLDKKLHGDGKKEKGTLNEIKDSIIKELRDVQKEQDTKLLDPKTGILPAMQRDISANKTAIEAGEKNTKTAIDAVASIIKKEISDSRWILITFSTLLAVGAIIILLLFMRRLWNNAPAQPATPAGQPAGGQGNQPGQPPANQPGG